MTNHKRIIIVTLLLLATTGCVSEHPVTHKHNIPIDPSILGIWKEQNNGLSNRINEELLVLKYSGTEYMVYYRKNNDHIYMRGYIVYVDDKQFVQLKVIGSFNNGNLSSSDTDNIIKKYILASYRLIDDELSVYLIKEDAADSGRKIIFNSLNKLIRKGREDGGYQSQ